MLKRLFADSDKYFTHIASAKKRQVERGVSGDPRTKLKEDKDRKFALLMVESHEGAKLAPGVLTKEAVQLYFERGTDDGIVAIHVSWRGGSLEPMFAKLADEMKLAAHIWQDDGERFGGKKASSWLILARSEKAVWARWHCLRKTWAANPRTTSGRSSRSMVSLPGWTGRPRSCRV